MLGLTGGYCAGKSTVAALLGERGWTVIDVDALGHGALEARLAEVAALLGPDAIRPDGKPDRRYIGSRVFADAGLLRRYEAIVHPAMFELVDRAIAAAPDASRVCLDAAILYAMPQAVRCSVIVEVRSPLPARVARGRLRDGLPPLRVLQRIARQGPLRARSRDHAARVRFLPNRGSAAGLARRLDVLLAREGLCGPAAKR